MSYRILFSSPQASEILVAAALARAFPGSMLSLWPQDPNHLDVDPSEWPVEQGVIFVGAEMDTDSVTKGAAQGLYCPLLDLARALVQRGIPITGAVEWTEGTVYPELFRVCGIDSSKMVIPPLTGVNRKLADGEDPALLILVADHIESHLSPAERGAARPLLRGLQGIGHGNAIRKWIEAALGGIESSEFFACEADILGLAVCASVQDNPNTAARRYIVRARKRSAAVRRVFEARVDHGDGIVEVNPMVENDFPPSDVDLCRTLRNSGAVVWLQHEPDRIRVETVDPALQLATLFTDAESVYPPAIRGGKTELLRISVAEIVARLKAAR